MEKYQIYEDIKTRTNGDIYVGVVGPVRVGKSTFISDRFFHPAFSAISYQRSKAMRESSYPFVS